MRHLGHYALAGLLVLATVPIYRFILTHRDQGVPVAVSAVHGSLSPPLFTAVPLRTYNETNCYAEPSKSECVDAFKMVEAMRTGRARCVAGVVYRTSDHVIEPWPPGNVQCTDTYGFRKPHGV